MWSKVLKPPYDLGARPVRVGSNEGVLDALQEEAESAVGGLLTRAREEAIAILQEAEHQAEEIRRLAHEEGHRAGRAEAVAIAEEAVTAKLRPLLDALSGPLQELKNLGDRVLLVRDTFVLDLAAALAEHIVGEALEDRERWVRRAVRLVETLDEREGPTRLFVSREMARFAEDVKARLEAAHRDIEVLVDQHLKPQDLLVEGTEGGLDGRVTETLQHILEGVLHAQHDVARGD